MTLERLSGLCAQGRPPISGHLQMLLLNVYFKIPRLYLNTSMIMFDTTFDLSPLRHMVTS